VTDQKAALESRAVMMVLGAFLRQLPSELGDRVASVCKTDTVKVEAFARDVFVAYRDPGTIIDSRGFYVAVVIIGCYMEMPTCVIDEIWTREPWFSSPDELRASLLSATAKQVSVLRQAHENAQAELRKSWN
jgi:hypothetical protein